MTVSQSFRATIVFFLAIVGIGKTQTGFVTTPVYGSNGSRAFPNQKAIAVGSDGFVRFVIGDSSPGGASDEITYVRCLDEDCVTSITATFAIGDWTIDYSIALGPDGFARIAYTNMGSASPPGNDGFLGLIQCADDNCASFSNTFVDGTSDNGVASVAVGTDGTSYIVYDWGEDVYGPQGVGLATCNVTCSTEQIAEISIYDVICGQSPSARTAIL